MLTTKGEPVMTRNGKQEPRTLSVQTRQLPCVLTETEIREAGKKLAHLDGELAAHTMAEKDAKDALKSKRSSLEGQIHALAGMIRAGEEYRPVDVKIVADYASGRVTESRQDTGEVISDRPLREDERQRPLFEGAPVLPARLGEPTEAEKAAAAERAELEKQADDLLDQAGDGAMNVKAMKGDAVAHRKARR